MNQATKRYLEFLATHKYELSTVELRACGQTPPETDEDAETAEEMRDVS